MSSLLSLLHVICNLVLRQNKSCRIFGILIDVRIGYACNLLQDTQKTVLDICYESEYNSIANFHRQFIKIKGYTPLQYRKYFTTAQHHSH
jgi:AraC-like DNA-binding protein